MHFILAPRKPLQARRSITCPVAIVGLALLVAMRSPAMAADETCPSLVLLPPPAGFADSGATAINNAGHVVGWARGGPRGATHAVLWDDDGPHDLGSLGGLQSQATDINDADMIVGGSTLSQRAADNPPQHAFLYRDGHMMDLGPADGEASVSSGLDSDGVIVGVAYWDNNTHAVIWRDGQAKHLVEPDGGHSIARGIGASGLVVGEVGGANDKVRPAVWRNGHLQLLELPIDPDAPEGRDGVGSAIAINGAGQIVGSALGASGIRGGLWDQGRWRFLDPDPAVMSVPHRISGIGQVVGEAGRVSQSPGAPTTMRPTLWDHNGGHDLADAASCDPAAAGWLLRNAQGIDDAGEIVGTATRDLETRGYLLTPETQATDSE